LAGAVAAGACAISTVSSVFTSFSSCIVT
jgi:hypothetical protein